MDVLPPIHTGRNEIQKQNPQNHNPVLFKQRRITSQLLNMFCS